MYNRVAKTKDLNEISFLSQGDGINARKNRWIKRWNGTSYGQKRILENFIAESIINKQEIPEVVLVTLGQEIRRLKRVVKDCKFRLATYK